MTISRAALEALKPLDSAETKEASCLFFNIWKDNPVVLDSWFAYEASRLNKYGIEKIENLLSAEFQKDFLKREDTFLLAFILIR